MLMVHRWFNSMQIGVCHCTENITEHEPLYMSASWYHGIQCTFAHCCTLACKCISPWY